YTPTSTEAQQIDQTTAAIKKFIQPTNAPKEFDEWQKKLVEILQNSSNGLSNAYRKKLDEAFANIQKQNDPQFKDLDNQHHRLEEQRDGFELALVRNQQTIATLEKQLAADQKQSEALGEKITGISATQLDEATHLLQEAEKQRDALNVQSIALRQLSETRQR